jgi:hypothetical protein
MPKKQRLPWGEYWRLVLRLNVNSGVSTSIPERELLGYYEGGMSPLDASTSAVRKRISQIKVSHPKEGA